jgi:hypothetical protein
MSEAEKQIDQGGSAFPIPNVAESHSLGMSFRDYEAVEFIRAWITAGAINASRVNSFYPYEIARQAQEMGVLQADALIAELKKAKS